jgi:Tfp pilus assembly protein PilO
MSALTKIAELPIGKALMISAAMAGLYRLTFYDTGATLEAQIQGASQNLTSMRERTVKADKELVEIKVLQEAQEKDAERLNQLLAYIPEKLTKIQLLQTISNEAKTVGVSLNRLQDTATPANKNEFYEQIGVEVELGGNFAQFMLFLSNLTRLNQIVTLETLALKTTSGSESESMSMNAVIRGYRYVEPPAAGSVPKK